jgi:hypothetical protein
MAAMSYMVSAKDLKKLLGENLKIIKFANLADYNHITHLLPNTMDCAVIFFADEMQGDTTIGHWTCLMRAGNKYEFFDSYGLSPAEDLAHIPREARVKFGEQINYLKNLLKNVKHSHNHIDYQRWGTGINTCGRFVIIRLYSFNQGYTNPKQFHHLMDEWLEKTGCKDYDELAVYLTEKN